MKRLFIFPNETGCFWIRGVNATLTRSLNEKEDGIKAVPIELEESINNWCSIILNGKWRDYDYEQPNNNFLQLGISKIKLFAEWLPTDWMIILNPDDFPDEFANKAMPKEPIEILARHK